MRPRWRCCGMRPRSIQEVEAVEPGLSDQYDDDALLLRAVSLHCREHMVGLDAQGVDRLLRHILPARLLHGPLAARNVARALESEDHASAAIATREPLVGKTEQLRGSLVAPRLEDFLERLLRQL